MTEEEPIRVGALHALAYCERLFYLEEVEEIRLADAAVFAGRTLHEELAEEEEGTRVSLEIESERWGIRGKMDAYRRRDGSYYAYEHKRGHCGTEEDGAARAWPSDVLQVVAYAVLLEEHVGERVEEGRIRYHGSQKTVRIAVDDEARRRLQEAIKRGRSLRSTTQRPPVTENAKLCERCSLAPVCLPEEERLAANSEWKPVRLFPAVPEGVDLHVTSRKAWVGKSGDCLVVRTEEGERKYPIQQVGSVIVHGAGQVSTQALQLCAAHEIGVHWFTAGGNYACGLTAGPGQVQRRIRQYQALTDAGVRLNLCRRLAMARVEGQLRYLLRATRKGGERSVEAARALASIRALLPGLSRAGDVDSIRGFEGSAARAYFGAVAGLLVDGTPLELVPEGRSRRPPQDRFNALLSFGYSMLHRSVMQAVLSVGLEPALGFYHTPRSAAHPLVLDLMELFRVPIWDMALIASINRKQWDVSGDFSVVPGKVWLSESGRRKAIQLYEARLGEVWRHPVTGYSLSYGRMMELEVRLLEKEWSGEPGLFARARLR
ncbi:MAG: type I-MYXAN CRISPR-associated endonuclease Cas1 [Bryobacteraceae bacterium]